MVERNLLQVVGEVAVLTCTRWHRLGERCQCGHVTVPAQFYKEKKPEEAYLAFLEENMPELHEKLCVPSRPITSKYKSGAEVRAALRKRERPHTTNKKPCASDAPKRLRRRSVGHVG